MGCAAAGSGIPPCLGTRYDPEGIRVVQTMMALAATYPQLQYGQIPASDMHVEMYPPSPTTPSLANTAAVFSSVPHGLWIDPPPAPASPAQLDPLTADAAGREAERRSEQPAMIEFAHLSAVLPALPPPDLRQMRQQASGSHSQ